MDFQSFERRAQQIFEEIPPEYRAGVEGIAVVRDELPHPTLPDIYTLGECRSEFYPSEFGGAGEVRSVVVLFYGSFVALSGLDEEFDWEGELFETVTHEVRHHLESLASEDALEVQDYAEDQNFARRAGEAFDPFFYRTGQVLGPGTFQVDTDVFIEQLITPAEWESEPFLNVVWNCRSIAVPRPERLGDVHFVEVIGPEDEGEALVLVLVRRQGVLGSLKRLFAGPPEVLHSEVELEAGE